MIPAKPRKKIRQKFTSRNLGHQRATELSPPESTWLKLISPEIHFIWKISWTANLVTEKRILYSHCLALPLRGSAQIKMGGKSFSIEQGKFLIIPPGQWHLYQIGERGLNCIFVHFSWISSPTLPGWKLSTVPEDEYDPKLLITAPLYVPREILIGTYRKASQTSIFRFWSLWEKSQGTETLSARGALLETLIHLLAPKFKSKEVSKPLLVQRLEEILSQTEDQ
jgi:hypothetical protein